MTSSTIFSGVSPISLPPAATGGNSPLTLRDMLFFLRMRWLWIAATTFAFLVLAGSYVLTAEPTFVANTQLVIVPQVSGSEAQRAFAEDAFIEGQLEIAKSSDVVGGTVTALGLDTDPDFVDQTPSLQDRAKNWLMALLPNRIRHRRKRRAQDRVIHSRNSRSRTGGSVTGRSPRC